MSCIASAQDCVSQFGAIGGDLFESIKSISTGERSTASTVFDSAHNRLLTIMPRGGPKYAVWQNTGQGWSPLTVRGVNLLEYAGCQVAYDAGRGTVKIWAVKYNNTYALIELDGDLLTLVSPGPANPTFLGALGFDQARGQMLVDGCNGIKIWDGANWLPSPAVGDLESRVAWDPANQRLIRTGFSLDGNFATYVWNGTDWVRLSSQPRGWTQQYTLVWDEANQRMLAGDLGTESSGNAPHGLWQMATDGTWTPVLARGLVARTALGDRRSLYFDPFANEVRAMSAVPQGTVGGLYRGSRAVNTYAIRNNDFALVASSVLPQGRDFVPLAPSPAQPGFSMFGGYSYVPSDSSQARVLGDTWRWNGQSWSDISDPARTAAARYGSPMVATGGNEVLLVAGPGTSAAGQNASIMDTQGWRSVTVPAGLANPNGACAAYDPDARMTIVFGGTASSTTWGFDGATWRVLATTGPDARSYASMAYDSRRKRIILIGGVKGTSTYLGDTWAWQNGAWTRLTTLGLGTRAYSAAAYDSVRDKVYILGGVRGTALLGDMREFDGREWRVRALDQSVSMSGHALWYNAAADRLELFGGSELLPASSQENLRGPWITTISLPNPVLVQQQPHDVSVQRGRSATFTVITSGADDRVYQWLRNNVPLANGLQSSGAAVSGAATSTLTVTGVQPADTGSYECRVTSLCSTYFSDAAQLLICAADFNSDGFVTFEDFDAFVGSFEAGAQVADFDADGFLTFEDFDAFVVAFTAGC